MTVHIQMAGETPMSYESIYSSVEYQTLYRRNKFENPCPELAHYYWFLFECYIHHYAKNIKEHFKVTI